jgi:hypothetical protein
MKAHSRIRPAKISALISDVDGTLVTYDKILTARAQAAVADLRASGILFSIISSRPPRGLRVLLASLGITAPIGGFNGGVLVNPDLSAIREHLLTPQVARRAIELLDGDGVQPWVFAGQDWLVRNAGGPYIGIEERTIDFPPTIVDDLEPFLNSAAKIVGVSAEFERLAGCERNARAVLAGEATVVRSQPYYLDFTHPLANKGTAFSEIAKLWAVPAAEIAVIGDGANDIAMFDRCGLSIAMGNGSQEVRQAADLVTGSNSDDGFANAVERFILGGVRSNQQVAIAGAEGHS